MVRNKKILNRSSSALLIVDIQERIIKAMRKHDELIENVTKLIKGAKIIGIPIYSTEQYPKGLGTTVESITIDLENEAEQKTTFSCIGANGLFEKLKKCNISQVIVCGIESHVCVQQTVLDLLENDFQVNLPINAVSSRYKIDYKTAVKRMEKNGVEITTVESVLFELLETSGTPEFKSISALIK
jgi:nicotinamidase-related amidase